MEEEAALRSPSEMTGDEILMELSAIAIELADVPEDDFARRIELRDRRSELRAEFQNRSPGSPDVVSMRRELTGLRRRLAEINKQRPNVAAMNDGGEGQGGMAENQQFAWDYDRGTGRNAIRERIELLERRIAAAREFDGEQCSHR